MKIYLTLVLTVMPLICNAQDALQNCRESLSKGDYSSASRSGRQAGGFDGLMCSGRAQLSSGNYAGALDAFLEAGKQTQNPFSQMLVATFQARASNALGKPDDALALYAQSLEIARRIGQKQALMINLNESAKILQARGEIKPALERFKEAYLNAANDNERSECNHFLAFAYMQSGDFDKAIEHQLKSVVLDERSGDANQYIRSKLDFSEILMKSKNIARAQKELDESLKIARSVESLYWEVKVSLYSSRLLKLSGNPDQSKALLEKARELARSSGDEDLIKEASSENFIE